MLAEASLLTFNGTIIVQAVIFIIVAIGLWRLAWGPLTAQIAARNEKIEHGLKAAQEAEQRLVSASAEVQKELEQARTQAREIITRAHQEATTDADAVRTNARRESDAIVEKARADIEAERDRALQELRAQVSALVVEAAGKVLGQAIDARAHERLIEESISSVSARS
jgi:F-type H+-transporting ATPase subunit b